jgi:HIV Tat-specific factor 1
MKYVFTLDELEEDEGEILDIKDEIRDEAGKFGEVTKVVLFDKEVDGVVTVRFKDFESAENFCKVCNGRNFAKRKLEITIAEDRPKFKKSNRVQERDSSDEEN